MRDGEVGLHDFLAAVEQDVHVDDARAPAERLLAAERLLDLLAGLQKPARGERRLADGADVHEGLLVGVAPRGGLVEGGGCGQADAGDGVERVQRAADHGDAVADIAAEPEADLDRHARRLVISTPTASKTAGTGAPGFLISTRTLATAG